MYGKQTEIKDYASKAIKFIYDSHDKLVRTEYADGNTVTYDYTPSGRLKSQTDAQGTITNTYDSMGRLKTQTNTNGETISYGYDGVGNIVEIVTPTQTISKTYTKRNELESVTDEKGTTAYTYDALGRQTKVSYPNGITTHYIYDSRNRITKIEHKNSNGEIIQSFAYTLDNVGNRTQIVEDTGRTVNYEYNSVYQLTKEIVSNDSKQNNTVTVFEYDEVGNLKTKTINGLTTTYDYNDNDQLISQDTQIFTYDDNGNLIAKDDTIYSYDAKNRLIKVTTPTDTVEYAYDANDNRIAKTTSNGTTTYLVDTNTPYAQVITESKTDGTQVSYTYGNDLISNGSNFYLTDALGSTRGLVDGGERLTDSYSYTPYGELSEHNGTSENSFLYTGEQLDPETENYYLRARYYSPQQARFTSIDPFEGYVNRPNTLNDYIYAGSNPTRFIDPSGKMYIANLASAITLRVTTLSTRLAVPFSHNGLKDLMVEGLLNNGQSVVVDLVTNFVFKELVGFDPDFESPRDNGKAHTQATAGTAAHKRLEYAIGEYKPFGDYVTLKAEVYYENKKDGSGDYIRSKRGGKNNTIGIDIEVFMDGDLKVIMDLKTGKSGFSLDRARDHGTRSGGTNGFVPVVEIFLPYL